MFGLADQKCVPCAGGVAPLDAAACAPLLEQLDGWTIVDGHHLSREFRFPDFATALAFVVAVGEIAEHENHHPDLALGWGRVRMDVWTHKIDGLTESDFILAAKADREHHPEPEPMRQVWRAPDPTMAHLMAGHLDSMGIRAVVQGESLFAGEGSILPQEAGPTIWVAVPDAERAEQILTEHQRHLKETSGEDE